MFLSSLSPDGACTLGITLTLSCLHADGHVPCSKQMFMTMVNGTAIILAYSVSNAGKTSPYRSPDGFLHSRIRSTVSFAVTTIGLVPCVTIGTSSLPRASNPSDIVVKKSAMSSDISASVAFRNSVWILKGLGDS